MRPMKTVFASLALFFPLTLVSACTQVVNPATGQKELTAMSPEQEQSVGKAEHPKVLQQFGGEYDDPELKAYVDQIGERLKEVSELPDLDFTFTLLNSDVVNAFALPGGYVYVSRGLMALAENEAEVAGVIAHEIGHVTARHSAQRYSRGVVAQGATTIGTLAAAILLGGDAAKLAQQVGGTAAKGVLASYSREQEFQSDELGVRYLTRAGYDPTAMATFLEKLGENSELARKLAGKDGAPDPSTSMFATHPRTPDRVRRAAENAADAASNAGRIGRNDYLQKIDGMIYGDDPSQGFVRGTAFVHPELRFTFETPDGYRLQNTPKAVIGRNKDGNVIQFDGAKKRSSSLRDYLANEWAKELKIQNLSRINSFDLDGLPAVSASTSGKSKDGTSVDVGLAAIEVAEGQVYRFTFIHPGGMSESEARASKNTVESFRLLSQREASSYRPKRIEVVRAGTGDSAERLASRMAVDDLPELQFQVLNGLDVGEQPERGSLVKLISQ